MTKIDYIKADLDLIKFGLSGFLGGFFLIVIAIYAEDGSITRTFLLIPLIIIAIVITVLLKKYNKKKEELN